MKPRNRPSRAKLPQFAMRSDDLLWVLELAEQEVRRRGIAAMFEGPTPMDAARRDRERLKAICESLLASRGTTRRVSRKGKARP